MKCLFHHGRIVLFSFFLLLFINICHAQTNITGQILSKSDQTPIAGASVIVKGSKEGSATDVNGRFSIRARQGDVLVISGVGITTQEVVVGTETNLVISVTASAKDLNEVVVTALGIKKEKRAVGYATQEVKGEALEKATEPNIVNGLNGKVAGLTINTATTMFENSRCIPTGAGTCFGCGWYRYPE